jgi:uncharacterized protein YdiU (UPF0061 family)
MSYARIAMALGVRAESQEEEAAVLSAVTHLNEQVRSYDRTLAELRTLTGKQSDPEMLGALRGMTEAANQNTTLRAELAAKDKKIEDAERDAIMAADAVDPKGRKITPAMMDFWKGEPVAKLKAFLEKAPHVVQMSAVSQEPGTQTSGTNAGGNAGDSGASEVTLKHEGKSWDQMSGMDKADLHETNKEKYDQMRDDFKKRGRPAQKRAS